MLRSSVIGNSIFLLLFIMVIGTSAWHWGERRRRRRCATHSCSWRWSGCSVTCGGGTSKPEITASKGPCGKCNLPSPKTCNTQCCTKNCIQTQWSIWSDCTTTCGAVGVRIKRRQTTQNMACGGTPCGSTIQTKPCSRFCLNLGSVGNGKCNCRNGWKGKCCEEDVNECLSTTCTAHSKCFNELGSYECVCDKGFSKYRSKCLDVDECRHDFHSCHKMAECINIHGHYECRCDPGYTGNGITCTDIDECRDGIATIASDQTAVNSSSSVKYIRSKACHAKASCNNSYGSYSCQCHAGYSGNGVACDDINECKIMADQGMNSSLPIICHGNASCVNSAGSYHCECKGGFIGNGSNCKEINECESQPCQNGGTCVDLINKFQCLCAVGFNGVQCEKDIDECYQNLVELEKHTTSGQSSGSRSERVPSCHDKATCFNTFGSYACVCNDGYSGNGFYCTDYDECDHMTKDVGSGYATFEKNVPENVNVSKIYRFRRCDRHSNCINSNGGFICDCAHGYDGNGFICKDLDECDIVKEAVHDASIHFVKLDESAREDKSRFYKIVICHVNATCTNFNGSYACQCNEGLQGNGFSCEDVDECKIMAEKDSNSTLPMVCHSNTSCANSFGSYHCECKAGFAGNVSNCKEINECESQPCQNGGTCVDLINKFQCHCTPGFEGVHCEKDTDECYQELEKRNITRLSPGAKNGSRHNCHANATCLNSVGSYACVCNNGYSGNGVQCTDYDECSDMSEDIGSGYATYEKTVSENINASVIYRFQRCDAHATCTNFYGRYICECEDGYAGNGYICKDIDECDIIKEELNYGGIRRIKLNESMRVEKPHFYEIKICHANATCTNYGGNYTCQCNEGLLGDGFLCEEIPPIEESDTYGQGKISSPASIVLMIIAGILLVAIAVLSIKIIRRNRTGGMIISLRSSYLSQRGYSQSTGEDAF